ncbi:MAG TPA: dihydrofolate reductase family protein [Acidimicrobiia bacterium]|nr:dihydrofolate reductase family protein [Acidimicrobiia bacterium]
MADAPSGDAPALQALYPQPGPADLNETYRPTRRRAGRWVRLNMVASLDGGTAVEGRSGGLGGPADRALFFTLRSFADVILVGAATMRMEHYGPPTLSDELRDARLARGQTAEPTIAVISRRVDFDWNDRFFVAADPKPIVFTVAASSALIPSEAPLSDVIVAGDDRLDLPAGLERLTDHGYHDVLVEGGPSINALLAAADEIDELCLTLSPQLVGGSSGRILRGAEMSPRPLVLASVLTAADFVFLRYCRPDSGG